jgi:hypothetical protein
MNLNKSNPILFDEKTLNKLIKNSNNPTKYNNLINNNLDTTCNEIFIFLNNYYILIIILLGLLFILYMRYKDVKERKLDKNYININGNNNMYY